MLVFLTFTSLIPNRLKRFTLLLFIFLFSVLACLAQERRVIDSLQNEINKYDAHKKELGSKATSIMDSCKANLLYRIYKPFYKKQQYDSALKYAQLCLTLSQNIGYKRGMANAYSGIGMVYYHTSNCPAAIEFNKKSVSIREEIGDKKDLSISLNNIGIIYDYMGNYAEALNYLQQSLKIREELSDKAGIGQCYFNMGLAYQNQGNFPEALSAHRKALQIEQEIGDKLQMALSYHCIGLIYENQNNYPEALKTYFSSLKISEEMGSKKSEAVTYSEIGVIYNKQGKYEDALKIQQTGLQASIAAKDTISMAMIYGDIASTYKNIGNYEEALKNANTSLAIQTKIHKKQGIATDYEILGNIYQEQKNYKESIKNYLAALNLFEEIGEKQSIVPIYINLCTTDYKQGNLQEAIMYNNKGLELALAGKEYNNLKELYSYLALINAKLGNYKEAYNNEILFKQYYDSIYNKENEKKITTLQLQYDFDKKQDSVKAEQVRKDAVADKEIQNQKNIKYALSGGLLLVLFFAGFILRSLRTTRRQKDLIGKQKAEVEQQKHLVEEKNKDILDSITYAKRLQDAILPPLSIIKQYLPQSFLLYKPKDIVAGDFYWMEQANDLVLIAAADCTGHGVPGALVSVVCSNALNRTVKEFRITEPGKILDKVRELVLETFEKSEDNVQDGMDISLCCINTKTKEVQWSGAYNSLWYLQNGQLHEVPADKQPIGRHDKPQPFSTHNLNLQKGDALYLFTDGYADQFGGPKGKKFKYKQLEELILMNAAQPMEAQKTELESKLEVWKGDLEQVDDILIIGIKI